MGSGDRELRAIRAEQSLQKKSETGLASMPPGAGLGAGDGGGQQGEGAALSNKAARDQTEDVTV